MAAPSWITLLLVTAAARHADDVHFEDSLEMKMLQLNTVVSQTTEHLRDCGHLLQPPVSFSNNCEIHTHGQDCYRPVPEVMAEHPGEDGYCYFNWTGSWVLPVRDREPNFEGSAATGILGLRSLHYEGFHGGPKIRWHFEGQELTTYLDATHYAYDDLYGYSLGYLQGQGLDSALVKNSSLWTSISEQKCKEIQQKYHFKNDARSSSDMF